MYSVVLMTALTAGSATPDWHRCGVWCGGYGGCGGACYGGCHGGGYGAGYDGYGCYGCWGGYSNWSYGCASYPGSYAPSDFGTMSRAGTPGRGIGGEELGKPKANKNDDGETMAPARARLVVEVPADARLFIDDVPVKVTAGVRTFTTPALPPGRPYFYVVRVERMREGGPVSETRRVIVYAGQIARADFKALQAETVTTAQAK